MQLSSSVLSVLLLTVTLFSFTNVAQGQGLDFMVIGDSQLWGNKFGFSRFFSDLHESCPNLKSAPKHPLYNILAISGSGLQDWTREAIGPNSEIHGDPCNDTEDFDFKGNMIPEGALMETFALGDVLRSYPGLCTHKHTAIDGVNLRSPKVVIATFLGAHQKLDDDPEPGDNLEILELGFQRFIQQLDPDTACIVMTNPPLAHRKHFPQEYKDFWKKAVENQGGDFEDWWVKKLEGTDKNQTVRRTTAEKIHQLVEEDGRCSLVRGFDEKKLIPLFENPRDFFGIRLERMAQGDFDEYDPFHLTEKGSYEFFKHKGPELCKAIEEVWL